ncbi:MAG: hypothetical protein ACYSWU_24235 [Planctomycetota bacterium]
MLCVDALGSAFEPRRAVEEMMRILSASSGCFPASRPGWWVGREARGFLILSTASVSSRRWGPRFCKGPTGSWPGFPLGLANWPGQSTGVGG